jgi:hypothetical protein
MAEELVVRLDMNGDPYQLVFTEESLVIKDRIVTPAGETELETEFADADIENLVVHQTITNEAMITLEATTYRLYHDGDEWTLVEVSP